MWPWYKLRVTSCSCCSVTARTALLLLLLLVLLLLRDALYVVVPTQ
jgi:hypothetical protein